MVLLRLRFGRARQARREGAVNYKLTTHSNGWPFLWQAQDGLTYFEVGWKEWTPKSE